MFKQNAHMHDVKYQMSCRFQVDQKRVYKINIMLSCQIGQAQFEFKDSHGRRKELTPEN